MTRKKAIDRILSDLGLTAELEDFVSKTMARLGCGDTLDHDTVKAVEQVIRNEFNS